MNLAALIRLALTLIAQNLGKSLFLAQIKLYAKTVHLMEIAGSQLLMRNGHFITGLISQARVKQA
jgi:cytoskeletal protein CcmA (bactofilin family)